MAAHMQVREFSPLTVKINKPAMLDIDESKVKYAIKRMRSNSGVDTPIMFPKDDVPFTFETTKLRTATPRKEDNKKDLEALGCSIHRGVQDAIQIKYTFNLYHLKKGKIPLMLIVFYWPVDTALTAYALTDIALAHMTGIYPHDEE